MHLTFIHVKRKMENAEKSMLLKAATPKLTSKMINIEHFQTMTLLTTNQMTKKHLKILSEPPKLISIKFSPLVCSLVVEVIFPERKPKHISPQRYSSTSTGAPKAFPDQRGYIYLSCEF